MWRQPKPVRLQLAAAEYTIAHPLSQRSGPAQSLSLPMSQEAAPEAEWKDVGDRLSLSLVTQLCPTHCNPVDWTPPGSSVHVHGDSTGKHNWSGLPFISPGALSNQRIEPRPPALQADSLYLTHLGSSATAQQASQGQTLSLPGPGEAPVDTCHPRISR